MTYIHQLNSRLPHITVATYLDLLWFRSPTGSRLLNQNQHSSPFAPCQNIVTLWYWNLNKKLRAKFSRFSRCCKRFLMRRKFQDCHPSQAESTRVQRVSIKVSPTLSQWLSMTSWAETTIFRMMTTWGSRTWYYRLPMMLLHSTMLSNHWEWADRCRWWINRALGIGRRLLSSFRENESCRQCFYFCSVAELPYTSLAQKLHIAFFG